MVWVAGDKTAQLTERFCLFNNHTKKKRVVKGRKRSFCPSLAVCSERFGLVYFCLHICYILRIRLMTVGRTRVR